jgi:type IV pilus assembly protein PilC
MHYVVWQAINSQRELVVGSDFVSCIDQLSHDLHARGLVLVSKWRPPVWWLAYRVSTVWRHELEQVMILVRSHVPLYQALEITAQHSQNSYVKLLLSAMARAVGNGSDIALICDTQARIIGPLYGQICRVGMQTGTVAVLLQEYLALENFLALQKRRLRAQMAGPLIMLTLLIFLIIGGLYALVPLMQQLYAAIGSSEPSFMVLLGWVRSQAVAGAAGLGAVTALLIGGWYMAGARARYMRDQLLYRMILIGPISRSLTVSQWGLALSTFLAQKLPLVQALYMTELMADGPIMKRILHEMGQELLKGKCLSDLMMHYPAMFPPSLIMVVTIGLASHHLDSSLKQWSQARMQQLEADIARLQIILLCIVYGCIALGALLLIFALYQPLWHMPDLM